MVDNKALYCDGRLKHKDCTTEQLLRVAQPGFRFFKELKSTDGKYPDLLEDVNVST